MVQCPRDKPQTDLQRPVPVGGCDGLPKWEWERDEFAPALIARAPLSNRKAGLPA